MRGDELTDLELEQVTAGCAKTTAVTKDGPVARESFFGRAKRLLTRSATGTTTKSDGACGPTGCGVK